MHSFDEITKEWAVDLILGLAALDTRVGVRQCGDSGC